MSEIQLNKFEKRALILRLLKEGKTYREICHIAHVSPRDIKAIAKEYERKKRLETKKGEQKSRANQNIKKLSKSSQAYDLFRNGKKAVEVAIDLDLDFQKVRKYWLEYLRLNRMKKLYNIYIENEYHLDYLLHIYFFMLRNKIPKKGCETVLLNADTVIQLNNSISNLKLDCETWQRVKYNHDNAPLEPLPRINPYHFKNF
jgi:hypothetical protein